MTFGEHLAKLVHAAAKQQPLPFVVALCGWADTGKSTLATAVCEQLRAARLEAGCLPTDAFLKDRRERNALGITGYDPLSVSAESIAGTLEDLLRGRSVSYRPYDNRSGEKGSQPNLLEAGHVLVVEGIHAMHTAIDPYLALRVFIDADESTLRHLRKQANVAKRGMAVEEAGKHIDAEWEDFCRFILPKRPLAQLQVRVDRDYNYSLELPGRSGIQAGP